MTYTPRNSPTDAVPVSPAVDGNLEEDTGDQKKVTDSMLVRFMRNIAYLLSLGVSLQDSTDPELRKWFVPPLIDTANSYGMILNSGANTYQFDNSVVGDGGYTDDLITLDKIDTINTTAYIDLVNGQATLPPAFSGVDTLDRNNACAADGVTAKHINTYWYIGWEKGKAFWMSPNWLADPFSQNSSTPNEPSVLRAMTFQPSTSGVLSKVQIVLFGNSLAEDDAYVEIRTTSNGVPTQNVLYRQKIDLRSVHGSALVAVPFQHPIQVSSSNTYAIVVRGGMTSWANKYGIGGWQVKCPGSAPSWGNPFISLDNGRTWINNKGYADPTFSEGNIRPREFAIQTYMQTVTTTYPTSGTYQVWWKAFRTNPIQTVQLSTSQTTPTGTSILWEVSTDLWHWHAVAGPSWNYNFANATTGEQNQNTIYIRATLSTTTSANTPSIQSLNVSLTTTAATAAYLRTQFYKPRLSNPMGAAIWSRLHAPVNMDPGCICLVDIIKNTEITEYITTDGTSTSYSVAEFPAYPMNAMTLVPNSGNPVTYTERKDYTVNYDTKVITFTSAPAAGTLQPKYYPIWLKGLTQDNFPQTPSTNKDIGFKTDLFDEFFNGDGSTTTFTLKTVPADPIRHTYVNGVELFEGKDFTVDYFNKKIIFNTAPSTGTNNIEMKYTPYLDDIGLAFAYRITRPDSTKQVSVLGNFFQNRV